VILQPLKRLVSGVDAPRMAAFSGQVWVILTVVAGVGVLSILHFLASSIRNNTYVHDMRVRVAGIRKEQAERLQALAEASAAAERESMAIAANANRKKAA
jgi:hypothetical protein